MNLLVLALSTIFARTLAFARRTDECVRPYTFLTA
jgi:hypothetical protein